MERQLRGRSRFSEGVGRVRGGFLEGYVADVEGALDVFVAFEEFFDGEELDAGVFVAR
jgi:hypothetical protein